MVVDTSILLAIFFREAHGEWAAQQLQSHDGELMMSTVNLVETLVLLRDRQPTLAGDTELLLLGSNIAFVPPDVEQARRAAAARLAFPLNLGDCFAYALARARSCAVLTLDRDFEATDVPLLIPH